MGPYALKIECKRNQLNRFKTRLGNFLSSCNHGLILAGPARYYRHNDINKNAIRTRDTRTGCRHELCYDYFYA